MTQRNATVVDILYMSMLKAKGVRDEAFFAEVKKMAVDRDNFEKRTREFRGVEAAAERYSEPPHSDAPIAHAFATLSEMLKPNTPMPKYEEVEKAWNAVKERLAVLAPGVEFVGVVIEKPAARKVTMSQLLLVLKELHLDDAGPADVRLVHHLMRYGIPSCCIALNAHLFGDAVASLDGAVSKMSKLSDVLKSDGTVMAMLADLKVIDDRFSGYYKWVTNDGHLNYLPCPACSLSDNVYDIPTSDEEASALTEENLGS